MSRRGERLASEWTDRLCPRSSFSGLGVCRVGDRAVSPGRSVCGMVDESTWRIAPGKWDRPALSAVEFFGGLEFVGLGTERSVPAVLWMV